MRGQPDPMPTTRSDGMLFENIATLETRCHYGSHVVSQGGGVESSQPTGSGSPATPSSVVCEAQQRVAAIRQGERSQQARGGGILRSLNEAGAQQQNTLRVTTSPHA